VFGRYDLHIIPQTSTIASHLPRAVGVAFSIARAKKLGVSCAWPDDAITVCIFGDASVNHSTAVGAINCALHASYQGVPMPLLFVCEDNGIGISVPTPRGWIEQTYGTVTVWRISPPTDQIWPRRSTRRPPPHSGYGPVGARPFCTCARAADGPTPVRTMRPRTGAPRRSPRTISAIRCCVPRDS
jgi:hypothetical protein